MSKLLVKFPTRNRPEKFKRILERYIEFLSGKHDVRFVITMDEDDETMNNKKMKSYLKRIIKKGTDLVYYYGNSKTKVEACNANMENEDDFDVLILISDDMNPQQRGYDDIIFQAYSELFPDFDGAIKFHDGLRNDVLMTLPVMGKKLYDRFDYIYNPLYTSLYCDTEQTEVFYRMNKLGVSNICIAKHEWTSAPFDELHARNENPQMYHKDGAIFNERRNRNFDIDKLGV
mgnify:CR=1 FL=1